VSVPTQRKEVPFWGLLGCAFRLVVAGYTRTHDVMPKPTHGPMATATLVALRASSLTRWGSVGRSLLRSLPSSAELCRLGSAVLNSAEHGDGCVVAAQLDRGLAHMTAF
jgi:hypothetical protein